MMQRWIHARGARSVGAAFLFIFVVTAHAELRAQAVKTTNPNLADTDGDGFHDGPDTWLEFFDTSTGMFAAMLRRGEDKNGNGKYEPKGEDGVLGTEDDESDPTNPTSVPDADIATIFDSDGDGFADALERRFGSIDLDADSDDDGVKDGDEVFIYHTSPMDPDSDHDGLPDGFELGLTFQSFGDGENSYNTKWHGSILKERIFYYKLPCIDPNAIPPEPACDEEALTYYDFAFRPLLASGYRSDPLSYDSDFDGIQDSVELESPTTDPMRGIVRNRDINDYSDDPAKWLDMPQYIQGWAPVNKAYQIYLNRVLDEDDEFRWACTLPISLGQSGQDITLSLTIVPEDPANPPANPPVLEFDGQSVSSLTITSSDITEYANGFRTAEVILVCPDPGAVASLTLELELYEGSPPREYLVGLSSYFADPQVADEYF